MQRLSQRIYFASSIEKMLVIYFKKMYFLSRVACADFKKFGMMIVA